MSKKDRSSLLGFLLLVVAVALPGCSSRPEEDPRATAWQQHHQAGLAAFRNGLYPAAEESWQQALDLARAFPDQDPRLHRTLGDLANLCAITGQPARAETLYTRLLALQQQTAPRGPESTATLDRLADLYRTSGQTARAETLYTRLLDLQETADPRHPEIPATLDRLADIHRAQGRLLSADSLASRAMALKLHQQGRGYFLNRNNRQAEIFYRRALTIQEKKLGDHPDLARTCYDLGLLCELQRDLAQAETFYRRALTIQENGNHPDLARTLDQLAGLLDRTDRAPEASVLRTQAAAARLHQAPDQGVPDRSSGD